MRFLFGLMIITTGLLAQYTLQNDLKLTYHQAVEHCKNKGERLPEIYELFALKGTSLLPADVSVWSNTIVNEIIEQVQDTNEKEHFNYFKSNSFTFYTKDGDVTVTPQTKRTDVICVDEPKKDQTFDHLSVHKLGVKDSQNHLIWLDLEQTGVNTKKAFTLAQEYCEALSIDERMWRLPTVEELYSIVDYKEAFPSVNTALFGKMHKRYYWSDDSFGQNHAYVVGFKIGSVATSTKTNSSYFRCVSDIE